MSNGDAVLDLLYGMSYVDAQAVMERAAEGRKDAIYKPNMAVVARVYNTAPIQGADFIEYAEVGYGNIHFGAVVQKGAFTAGGQGIMFLPDAWLPPATVFAFMEKYGYKVKMKRFKGVPSEVVFLPLEDLFPGAMQDELSDGMDVTPWLGVMKYEKSYPEDGDIEGEFPPYAPKTDEPLFQGVPHLVEALEGKRCYITTKADGSSQTIMWVNGELIGCSRRTQMKRGSALVWRMIRKYDLEHKLNDMMHNIAIQFEAVGPGIQGNPLKLPELDMRVFSIYDIDDQKYLGAKQVQYICDYLGVPMVEVIAWDAPFHYTSDDDLRVMAEGVYPGTNTQREGIVIRPMDEMLVNNERVSFKVINLRYKG